MFDAQIEQPAAGVHRYRLTRHGAPMTVAAVIEHLRAGEDDFREFFVAVLNAVPFACFRFEIPPANRATQHRAFEFALIDSPEIDLPPDPHDFRAHFDRRPEDVLVFDNLGGDATLVVPRPADGEPGYAHIAAFTRHAPVARQCALWRAVGDATAARLSDKPLWLNTAGGGVPWLHVRIDTRPKYYVHDEYRRIPE